MTIRWQAQHLHHVPGMPSKQLEPKVPTCLHKYLAGTLNKMTHANTSHSTDETASPEYSHRKRQQHQAQANAHEVSAVPSQPR